MPLGGFGIEKKLFEWIIAYLGDSKKTILELGSGEGSSFELSKHYKMYSVEHDKNWINKYDSTYIFAPIKNKWYDTEILARELPKQYDLLLIDGPPEEIGRAKMAENLGLFLKGIPYVFDDINRPEERRMVLKVSRELGKKIKFLKDETKKFAVIFT